MVLSSFLRHREHFHFKENLCTIQSALYAGTISTFPAEVLRLLLLQTQPSPFHRFDKLRISVLCVMYCTKIRRQKMEFFATVSSMMPKNHIMCSRIAALAAALAAISSAIFDDAHLIILVVGDGVPSTSTCLPPTRLGAPVSTSVITLARRCLFLLLALLSRPSADSCSSSKLMFCSPHHSPLLKHTTLDQLLFCLIQPWRKILSLLSLQETYQELHCGLLSLLW